MQFNDWWDEITEIFMGFIDVWWQARRDAQDLKVAVTGSEIVGLIPLRALLQAADYYIEKEKLMILHEDQKVHLAINRLGLSSLQPFNPKLVQLTISFINTSSFKQMNPSFKPTPTKKLIENQINRWPQSNFIHLLISRLINPLLTVHVILT